MTADTLTADLARCQRDLAECATYRDTAWSALQLVKEDRDAALARAEAAEKKLNGVDTLQAAYESVSANWHEAEAQTREHMRARYNDTERHKAAESRLAEARAIVDATEAKLDGPSYDQVSERQSMRASSYVQLRHLLSGSTPAPAAESEPAQNRKQAWGEWITRNHLSASARSGFEAGYEIGAAMVRGGQVRALESRIAELESTTAACLDANGLLLDEKHATRTCIAQAVAELEALLNDSSVVGEAHAAVKRALELLRGSRT